MSARAAVPGVQPGAHTPFVTALLRDWDQIDTNKDGVLSIAEIDRAVLDPSIKGDDAALVGTLKLMSRSTKVTVPRSEPRVFPGIRSAVLPAGPQDCIRRRRRGSDFRYNLRGDTQHDALDGTARSRSARSCQVCRD